MDLTRRGFLNWATLALTVPAYRLDRSVGANRRLADTTAEHPRLFVNAEDLKRITVTSATVPWAERALGALVARAESALQHAVAVPLTGAQSPQLYVCKVHNAELVTLSPVRHQCPVGKEVYTGSPYDEAALFDVHMKYFSEVEDLGWAFALTGDLRYAERALAILLVYAERYPGFPLHDLHGARGAAGYPWAAKIYAQTLDEAVCLVKAVSAYDCLASLGTAANRLAMVEVGLLRPAATLLRTYRTGRNNWACWHNAAVGLAGLALGDEELVHWAIRGDMGLEFQLAGLSRDGFWPEASISYHFYALIPIALLMEAAIHRGVDISPELQRRYQSMFEAPLELAYPDGRMPALGDGDVFSLAEPQGDWYTPGLYEIAARRRDGNQAAFIVNKSRRDSLYSLLWGDAAPRHARASRRRAEIVDGACCAVLRDDASGSYVLLNYTGGQGHGHLDALNVVAYCLGTEFSPDPGRASYQLPIYADYYRQTVSHNTVLIDQRGQQPAGGRAELLWPEGVIDTQGVRATVDGAYPGVRLTRTLVLNGPGGFWLDVMDVTADSPRTCDWLFHGRGVLQLSSLDASDSVSPTMELPYLFDVRSRTAAGTWGATWRLGAQGDVRLTMVTEPGSPADRIFTGTRPGQPITERLPFVMVRRREAFTRYIAFFEFVPSAIRASRSARSARHVPLRIDGQVAGNREGFGLEIRGGAGAYLLMYAPDAAGLKECGAISTRERISWHRIP